MSIVLADGDAQPVTKLANYYRVYVLGVLMLVGVCGWMDRQVFSIVLQSIKHDFSLTDTQLGFLGGTAFGLLYVGIGLPIAFLADRWSRRGIIAVAVGLWSAMTFLTGLATGYVSLFLCRMGVGIGEAGGAAPSQSLISAYFSSRHRALAMGALYTYIPLGYLLSYSFGGWVNDTFGWRNAFMVFALPGLALALIVRLSIREPARGQMPLPKVAASSAANTQSFLATLKYFLSRNSLRHLPLAGAAHGIGMFGAAVWMPSYFMRTFDLSASAVGLRLAFIMGLGGLVGTLSGGALVDRLVFRRKDARWYGWGCSLFLVGTLPFSLAMFQTRHANFAFLLFIVPTILNHMILGPVVAAMQNLAGAARRAMAAAFYLFLVNLIAAGFGPLLVGALSDLTRVRFGSNSLRISLLMLIPATSAWAATHMYLAARTMREDIAQADVKP